MTEKVRKNKNSQYFFENEIALYYGQFDVFCKIHSENWAILWGKPLVTLCKSFLPLVKR